MSETVELFSEDWCEAATKIWVNDIYDLLADSENYNYSVEWGVTDNADQVCQFVAQHGHITDWSPGQKLSAEEVTFQLWATKENWMKVANGSLDPVGAVAAKRIHLRKGPMATVVLEATAFTTLLVAYGKIPTNWS